MLSWLKNSESLLFDADPIGGKSEKNLRSGIPGARGFDLDRHPARGGSLRDRHPQLQYTMIVARFDVLGADSFRKPDRTLKVAVRHFAMDEVELLLLAMMLARALDGDNVISDIDFDFLWVDSGQIYSDNVFFAVEKRFD
jgi:hypothetical protein